MEQKLTLEQISTRTAIRKEFLEMLEAGEFERMPSYVHAHGFLSHYCKVVGLDFANEIKSMFDEECHKETFGKTPEEVEIAKSAVQSSSSSIKALPVVIFLAILALIVFVIIGVLSNKPAEKTSAIQYQPIVTPTIEENNAAVAAAPIDNISPTIPAEPVDQTEAVEPAEPIEPPEPEEPREPTVAAAIVDAAIKPQTRQATLTFTDNCWVNLMIDNASSVDFIAESGQSRVVDFSKYFRINIGNASAIAISYGERKYTGFGGFRQPVRNLFFVVDDSGNMSQTRIQPN
jgi:cytoskeletal protein RodZ